MMSTFKLRLEYGHPILIAMLVCGLLSVQAIPFAFAEKKIKRRLLQRR